MGRSELTSFLQSIKEYEEMLLKGIQCRHLNGDDDDDGDNNESGGNRFRTRAIRTILIVMHLNLIVFHGLTDSTKKHSFMCPYNGLQHVSI